MKLLLSLICLFPLLTFASGGSGGGNGGDTVRMRFFSIGHNIINYYQNGFKKINSVVKDPEELRNYLTINVVQTSVELLFDNLGNPVNAIGERNKIILYVGEAYKELSWAYILKDQRTAQVLILHEMLRAHGVNDDDYVYSNIVLREQDIVKNGRFKMKWSADTLNSIDSALVLSFRASNLNEEELIYQKAISEIKAINNLPYANLLSLQILLTSNITEATDAQGQRVSLLRKDLRKVKDILPMVDELAYQQILNLDQNTEAFQRIMLLLLRDFSMKYAEFSQTGPTPFAEYLEDMISAFNSDSYYQNECQLTNDSLSEIASELKTGTTKREVLRKMQMVIYSIKQGQC